MTAWQAGYVSDIEYTASFFRELSPDYLNTMCQIHGVHAPEIQSGFTYCELGCGQGHTVLMLAAMYPQGQFIGIDFNPGHIASAKKMADAAGITNIQLLDCSFEQLFHDNPDLPDCDYIVFHGISSWVNAENRAYITRLCERKLRPGGVVYNSYNALPGWTPQQPLQHMLRALANTQSGRSDKRMQFARDKLTDFLALKPAIAESLPGFETKLKELSSKPVNYLVHEYLHDAWRAFHASEIIAEMSRAKLTFVGQATPLTAYPALSVPANIREFIGTLPTIDLQQDFIDAALNTQFRRDIYVKGPVPFVGGQQLECFTEMQVQLNWHAGDVPDKLASPLGEITLNRTVFDPVIKALSKGAVSIKAILNTTGLSPVNVIESCMVLLANGYLHTVSACNDIHKAQALNKRFVYTARHRTDFQFLCAPKLGTGVQSSHVERLFLDGHYAGLETLEQLSEHAANLIIARGVSVVENGKTVSDPASIHAHTRREAEVWLHKTRSLWQTLGVF